MINIKVLHEILNPENSIRYLYIILAASLIPFADILLIIMAAVHTGKYLFLAVIIAFTLTGFMISRWIVKKNLGIIRNNLENHFYSDFYYNMFPGTLMVSFFLIMPGIIGTAAALIISIPRLRYRLGRYLSKVLKIDWKEIHEFINIIE
ncbi:MAG: FxsA family protein [Spirochaetales bacterium]|nr:FxsA family protein [Spirochaetales bacterium]